MAVELLQNRSAATEQAKIMTEENEIQFRLDPPARGSFGGHGECLIKDINFQNLRIVSGYSPPVGGKAVVFIPAPNGNTPLAVEVIESRACCPDKETGDHFRNGLVFSIRCRIRDLDSDARNSIIHVLESHFSSLRPAAG
ncbi:MAG TPA: hypothetical protein ENN40_05950 [Candidatus Aminicenantes bacterium]|nr:hypothetical protein [Candidatus Aminicenantes bacterium]